MTTTRYESAKEIYAKYGVDTDAAIAKLKDSPVALHCWQGDDVTGFDHDGPFCRYLNRISYIIPFIYAFVNVMQQKSLIVGEKLSNTPFVNGEFLRYQTWLLRFSLTTADTRGIIKGNDLSARAARTIG